MIQSKREKDFIFKLRNYKPNSLELFKRKQISRSIFQFRLSIRQNLQLSVYISHNKKLENYNIQMLELKIGFALVLCTGLNILSSRFGYSNIKTGDKDILLPFSIMIFLFYPLLIYLPETHYKVVTYGETKATTIKQTQQDEQQKFPFAFFITLVSITLCIIVHRLVLFTKAEPDQEVLNRRNSDEPGAISDSEASSRTSSSIKNVEYKIQSQILKYFLSLAIGLQNIVAAFYISAEEDDKIVLNQLIIFCVFSIIINFAYGYINGWSAVSKELSDKLSIFINIGLFLGFVLGLIANNNLIILVIPCFCCGLMIYSATLVGLPVMYSNGENQTQDKFRYGSIFTSLLITVVYHPFCYLLRV